jgi:hypothetical protein
MRDLRDCTTMDRVKNEDIREEIKTQSIHHKIDEYKQNQDE